MQFSFSVNIIFHLLMKWQVKMVSNFCGYIKQRIHIGPPLPVSPHFICIPERLNKKL